VASAGEQVSDFAFLAIVVSRLVLTEILAVLWLVLGLQNSSGAPSFNNVVEMMEVNSPKWVSAASVGVQRNKFVVLDAINDDPILREIVRLGKARSWAAEVRLGSGFRWRHRIGDGRGHGGGSIEFV